MIDAKTCIKEVQKRLDSSLTDDVDGKNNGESGNDTIIRTVKLETDIVRSKEKLLSNIKGFFKHKREKSRI